MFSSHAEFEICRASANRSLAFAARSKVSLSLVSLIPISFRTAIALFPFRSVSFNPARNALIAVVGLFLNAVWNSCPDMPAAFAYPDSPFPVSAASCIFTSNFEKALPPASASIPTDDRDAAYAMISACDSFTCVPAAAIRMPIATVSLSVVAMLFPRATTELPRRSKYF